MTTSLTSLKQETHNNTIKSKKIKVFVYGSLLSGLHNNGFLEGTRKFSNGTLCFRGRMVDLGDYPALELDQTCVPILVEGEVYEVDSLNLLDYLESNGILYQRYRVSVDTDHGAKTCWVYFSKMPRRILKRFPTVGNVDDIVSWRSHISEKLIASIPLKSITNVNGASNDTTK